MLNNEWQHQQQQQRMKSKHFYTTLTGIVLLHLHTIAIIKQKLAAYILLHAITGVEKIRMIFFVRFLSLSIQTLSWAIMMPTN